MSEQFVLGFAQEAIMVVIMIAAPALMAGLIVGLMVSVFQAVTQIQDMTLTFVPKILMVGLTIMFMGSWMLSVLMNFAHGIFSNLSRFAL